ncbi:MAG: rod shape-determining protein MreC [Planctomycetota bacterium]
MKTTRRSSFITASLLGIVFLVGFRPVSILDSAAAYALGILSYPYHWLGTLEIVVFGGGEGPDTARAMSAEESALDLRRRELAGALASDITLKSRTGVAANVINHESADATFEIDRGLRDGIAVGDPATHGDSLAGIVISAKPNSAVIRYLWHGSTRVCIQSAEPAAMRGVAVGATEGLLKLEVSDPREVPLGTVVTVATSPGGDALDFAAGFIVGTVAPAPPGGKPWIEPDLTIRNERFLHVVVRTRGVALADDKNTGEGPPAADRWKKIVLSPAGDASPGFKSNLTKINIDENANGNNTENASTIVNGSAVVVDGWVIGRIERAGAGFARVRHVEDTGFSIEAVLLPSDGPPIPLGILTTQSAGNRYITFTTEVNLSTISITAAGPVVTGASDATVPKGLRIGTARIENNKLIVEREARASGVTAAFVAGR